MPKIEFVVKNMKQKHCRFAKKRDFGRENLNAQIDLARSFIIFDHVINTQLAKTSQYFRNNNI